MNFISTFDELNKLYEELPAKEATKDAEASVEEGLFDKKPSHALIVKLDEPDNGYEWYSLAVSSDISKLKERETEAHASYKEHGVDTPTQIVDIKTAQKLTGEKNIAKDTDKLIEGAEDEEILIDDEPIADDETPVEEEPEVAEDAAKAQVVVECVNCGALAIKDETVLRAEEDSDVVNVDEACSFCEEQKGYKVMGTFIPSESTDEETEVVENADLDNIEESIEIMPDEQLDELFDANTSLGLDGGENNDVDVL